MSGFEAWVGRCHIRGVQRPDESGYECYAAVWTNTREGFDIALHQHLTPHAQSLLWAEDVFPITQWLQRNGHHQAIMGLARTVHARHSVELGTLIAIGQDGKPAPRPAYLTITEHEIDPLPEQSEMPFWDKEWIAPELMELLFGQPEGGPHLRTYLIVSAALRKNIAGVFDLDSDLMDVPVQCLFKGEAAEDLKEVAPYLIDMTLPEDVLNDPGLAPSFHEDFFKEHWGRNTGIFIRTTAHMSEVWNHYRKFTLVGREGHKGRVFAAFWSEQYVRLYFPHIADNQDRVATWFLRDGLAIHSMLAEQDGGLKVNAVTLKRELFAQHNARPASFVVTEYDLEPFYRERNNKDLSRLVEDLRAGFPQELKNYSSEAIHQIIADPIARMRGYGFSQKANLYLLGAWSIFFGKSFEQQDPDGRLLAICESDMSEMEKMDALKQRMAQFSAPREAAS